jgi:hypothetical protein
MSTSTTREELYELVWQEPMVKVAQRFSVSDVAVAKACRRHKIPLPGRGHWARIAAGQTITRPPLSKEVWLGTCSMIDRVQKLDPDHAASAGCGNYCFA